VKDRIVLAYSGTPNSSAAIARLAEQHGADVVTLTLDLGEGGDLQEVHERALAAGAVRAHVLDAREEFLRDYVLPAIQAGTLADAMDPMPRSLADPLIARKLADIARIERAAAVEHGPEPDLPIQPASTRKPSADAAGHEAHVEIAFEGGVPVAISGISMPLTELFESLAIIAAQHGIRPPSRFQDAPAAVVLAAAFAALNASNHQSPGTPSSGVVRLRLVDGTLHVSDLAALRS
jgi:argininosuccinate synthase